MTEHRTLEEKISRNEIRLNKHSEAIGELKKQLNLIEKAQLESTKDHQYLSTIINRLEAAVVSLENATNSTKEIIQASEFRVGTLEMEIKEVAKDLKEIKDKPAKRYEGITSTIITVIVTSILTYLITQII